MRKTFCALLTVILLTMVASCYTHDDRIPMALEMVENQKPDSAITILNSINQTIRPRPCHLLACLHNGAEQGGAKCRP